MSHGPFGLGGPEVLVICALAVLLFGGKKMGELGKGLGEGIKNFKSAMRSGEEDKEEKKDEEKFEAKK